jgi:hypothetical protein
LRFSAQPRGPAHALKTPQRQKSYRALALRRGYVRFLTRARGRRSFQSLFAPLRDARRPRGCASSRGSLGDRQSQKRPASVRSLFWRGPERSGGGCLHAPPPQRLRR